MLETVVDEAFSLLEHLSKPIGWLLASQRSKYPGVGDFELRIRMRITNLIMESFQHYYDELEGVIARMMTRGWPARMMVNQLDDWP